MTKKQGLENVLVAVIHRSMFGVSLKHPFTASLEVKKNKELVKCSISNLYAAFVEYFSVQSYHGVQDDLRRILRQLPQEVVYETWDSFLKQLKEHDITLTYQVGNHLIQNRIPQKIMVHASWPGLINQE